MEQLFYMADVRNPAEPDYRAPVKLSSEEKDLAYQLVERKTSAGFLPENYTDEQTASVQKRFEEKVTTGITITTEKVEVAKVQDLMEALRLSLAEGSMRKRRKASQLKGDES